MQTEDLRRGVREVIGQMCPLGARPADSADRLTDDLGYDSLAMIELSLQIESRFGLTAMDADDGTDIVTVGDVEDLVERMAATSAGAP